MSASPHVHPLSFSSWPFMNSNQIFCLFSTSSEFPSTFISLSLSNFLSIFCFSLLTPSPSPSFPSFLPLSRIPFPRTFSLDPTNIFLTCLSHYHFSLLSNPPLSTALVSAQRVKPQKKVPSRMKLRNSPNRNNKALLFGHLKAKSKRVSRAPCLVKVS